MAKITGFTMGTNYVTVSDDASMSVLPEQPGPPPSVKGFTVGLAEMTMAPPHNGERHPDGDELLIVLSGKIKLIIDASEPTTALVNTGEAVIVPKDTWHRIEVLAPTKLIYMTPGPRNDYR